MKMILTVDVPDKDVPYIRAMMAADYVTVSTPDIDFCDPAIMLVKS